MAADIETTQHVELPITGMTCASCANRIERKLNKLDGVTATVNYATEKARVRHPTTVPPELLVRTVEQVAVSLEDGTLHLTSSRPLDEVAVRGAVEEAGYTLG